MSELDELRTQNKELKRLLENALDLLEKSKQALTKQAKAPRLAGAKKKGAGQNPRKKAVNKIAVKKS